MWILQGSEVGKITWEEFPIKKVKLIELDSTFQGFTNQEKGLLSEAQALEGGSACQMWQANWWRTVGCDCAFHPFKSSVMALSPQNHNWLDFFHRKDKWNGGSFHIGWCKLDYSIMDMSGLIMSRREHSEISVGSHKNSVDNSICIKTRILRIWTKFT